MGKITTFTVFSVVISFFVIWEASGGPFDLETSVQGKQRGCRPDLFSEFPKSSEDIPGYVEHLEAVLRNSDNIYEKELAVKYLGRIGVTQPDSSSRAFQVLRDTFQNREHGNQDNNRTIKGLAMETATKLALDLSSEELSLELINQLLAFIAETKSNYLSFVALQSLGELTKKYPEGAFFTVKSILRIFGGEFKEDTSGSQSLVPIGAVSGGKSLSIFQKTLLFIRFPGAVLVEQNLKDDINTAIKKCTEIVLQSPPDIQDEIAEFLKNILRSDRYSKVHKDMALKIYGDFSLERLNKLSHQ